MKTEILDFLNQLLEAQTQTLTVLHKQQTILVRPTKETAATVSVDVEEALETMQQVLNRREELLTSARLQNIRSDSIEQLCEHFFSHNFDVQKLLIEAKNRTQQIHLLAYTNWTMTRKSQIHVSQILELLATRGRGKTTYQPRSKGGTSSSGSQVDRVA